MSRPDAPLKNSKNQEKKKLESKPILTTSWGKKIAVEQLKKSEQKQFDAQIVQKKIESEEKFNEQLNRMEEISNQKWLEVLNAEKTRLRSASIDEREINELASQQNEVWSKEKLKWRSQQKEA